MYYLDNRLHEVNTKKHKEKKIMSEDLAKYYSWMSEKLKKMRLYKVAEDTGISYGTLKAIEKGKANPTLATLETLRVYLESKF
jgi:DNA-binding Xre family transcriptional regulator